MSPKHILVAAISHETNSFSPVPTGIDAFSPVYGEEAYSQFHDTATAAGGFIRLARGTGANVSVVLIARALPSSPVDDTAYNTLSDTLCNAVEKALAQSRCDALFLELHGAMVTQSHEDGEGPLLSRLRAISDHLPIALSLDFHANVSAEMVAAPTAVLAYKTFPHLDMSECAQRVGRIALDAMTGAVSPVSVWGNLPLLVHLQCMNTSTAPFEALMSMARDAQRRKGVLGVSVLAGFPLADTREAGLSCIVTTNGDAGLAASVRDEILSAAWSSREDFIMSPEPLRDSVRRASAMASNDAPVLMLDVADTCNSGGTLDRVSVLREALSQNLEDVAMAPICDPETVQALLGAGIDREVEIDLGERVDAPCLAQEQEPLRLRGRLRAVHHAAITVTGPVFTGTRQDLGTVVSFESGSAQLVITSKRAEPYDPGIFRCVGIEPFSKRFIILKSRMQCKPAFLPSSVGYVDCNGTGVTTSDYAQFPYTRLRRPIFPFDPDVRWSPTQRPGSRKVLKC